MLILIAAPYIALIKSLFHLMIYAFRIKRIHYREYPRTAKSGHSRLQKYKNEMTQTKALLKITKTNMLCSLALPRTLPRQRTLPKNEAYKERTSNGGYAPLMVK